MLIDEVEELEIEMSTLCNARCPLCYRNYKSFVNSPYNKPLIRPFEDIVQQLDQYINLKYIMIVGSMSEPTLYPNFLQLVQYLKTRNIKIEICTNGDTKDDDFWNKLGLMLDDCDEVYFTICGSTQKMHEHYRKNTNLENILHHAEILRNKRKIDYAQCIRFNYNSDDLDSNEFKNIVKNFSHVYMTETFYPKSQNNYVINFLENDFIPNKHKLNEYNKLKKLAEAKFQSKIEKTAICQSLQFKRQQIDVFGNVYPCYLFLEYFNGMQWNRKYNDILAIKYDCCKFCDKVIKEFGMQKKLDYII